jgi:hypothetical protein
MSATRIELLQGMPIFGALREDSLHFLLDLTRSVSVRSADFFFYKRDIEQFTLIQMNLGRELSRRLRATDEQLFRREMAAGEGVDVFRSV